MAARRTFAAAVVVALLGTLAYLATRPADNPPAAAPSPDATSTATTGPGELFVAPGADGDCSRADPCGTLDAGLAAASPGKTVRLAGGDYREQLLRSGSSHDGAPVRLVADPADPARIGRLLLEARNVEIVGVTVRGEVRVRKQAADVTLTDLDVVGIVDIEADRTVLQGSRVVAQPDRDAINVRSGPSGVRLIGNVVGPGSRSPGSPAHVDCLQVSAATDLLIEGNTMFRCPAQTILIKADRGPITDVVVRDNVLQGCLSRTQDCDGFKTLQIRTAQEMRDIVVEGNTIDGAVVFDKMPGLVIERNLMTGDPGCSAGATDNIVGKSSCPQANRVEPVTFAGREDEVPDLEPTDACDCAGYGVRAG